MIINPYYSISETPSSPLGLAYIAAALEREDVEVKILDFVVFPYSRQLLESVLKNFAPRIVGTTAVTMTFDNAINVIKEIKSIDPSITTVVGGPHVTFCAKETMSLKSGKKKKNLTSGSFFVIAAYQQVRFIPQDSRALHNKLFTLPSEFRLITSVLLMMNS